jgi:hypothetical protein
VVVIVVVYLVRVLGFGSCQVGEGPVLSGVGVALFVLGLALAVWARLYIGRNWGTPMSRKDEPELVTTGPYRRRTPRHARMRCVLTRSINIYVDQIYVDQIYQVAEESRLIPSDPGCCWRSSTTCLLAPSKNRTAIGRQPGHRV